MDSFVYCIGFALATGAAIYGQWKASNGRIERITQPIERQVLLVKTIADELESESEIDND